MGSLKKPAPPKPSFPSAHLSLQWMLLVEVSCLGALVVTPKGHNLGLVLSDTALEPEFGVGNATQGELDGAITVKAT